MAASVDVSVEALQECSIQEIGLDGQETYKLPMTMSEEFTMLVNLIDFSQGEGGDKKDYSEVDEADDEESKYAEASQASWPWESVRNKLRMALMELSVLQDILTISRDRQYMTLDNVPLERNETKSGLIMIARKKALAAGGAFVTSGLERMKRNLDNTTWNKISDFHYELLKLRKTWRLKKVGGAILGDLSYKSAGSTYWKNGTFEITKTDSEQSTTNKTVPTNNPHYNALQQYQAATFQTNLSVTLPNDLLGTSRIKVAVKQVNDDTFKLDGVAQLTKWYRTYLDIFSSSSSSAASSSSSSSSSSSTPQENIPWVKRLELSQNVIFCEELFTQLYQEAVEEDVDIAYTACGNHMIFQLFDDLKLFVSLCHAPDAQSLKRIMQQDIYTDPVVYQQQQQQLLQQQLYNNKKKKSSPAFNNMPANVSNTPISNTATTTPQLPFQAPKNTATTTTHDYSCLNEVLEHLLYQLLRFTHQQNATLPMPHPTSASLSLTPWRHVAGPKSFSKAKLTKLADLAKQRKVILNPFIKQVKNTLLRIKVLSILDRLVHEFSEPQFLIHPTFLNSTTKSCIRLHIFFTGFELTRTNLTFLVGDDEGEMRVALRDGTTCLLRVHEKDITAVLHKQLLEHYVHVVQMLAKVFGWRVSSLCKDMLLPGWHDEVVPPSPSTTSPSTTSPPHKVVVMTLTSPYHDKEISVTCSSTNQQQVFLKRTTIPSSSSSSSSSHPQQSSSSHPPPPPSSSLSSSQQPLSSSSSSSSSSAAVTSSSGASMERTDEVHMRRMPGKNFAQKFETLLAALNPDLTN